MSGADLADRGGLPPFAALRAFDAVGRLGGIRKGAAGLGLDHTVISRHIRLLEDRLGTPLFDRSSGRFALTAEGMHYHGRVSAALNELSSATSEIQRPDNKTSIRLWCVPGFAAQWLSAALIQFESAHPEFRVELRPTDIAADLLNHEADVDIRYYGDDWLPKPGGRGSKAIELARPAVFPVASPDVATSLGRLNSVQQLVDATLLHEEHDEQWRAWLRVQGVSVEGKIEGPVLWHAHLAIAAARSCRGVALANKFLVAQELQDGSLVRLSIPGEREACVGSYIFEAREDHWSMPILRQLRRFIQAKLV